MRDRPVTDRGQLRYQPYYCEENAWWLCQTPALGATHREVLFVSNPERAVSLWEQRAVPPGEPVVWDYHVVVLSAGQTWDLDTRLALPCATATYLQATFRRPPLGQAPVFRVLPGELYVRHLATDRRHMRRGSAWLQPPPEWAPPQAPGEPPNLQRFIDMQDPWLGERLSLAEMQARYPTLRGEPPPPRSGRGRL